MKALCDGFAYKTDVGSSDQYSMQLELGNNSGRTSNKAKCTLCIWRVDGMKI